MFTYFVTKTTSLFIFINFFLPSTSQYMYGIYYSLKSVIKLNIHFHGIVACAISIICDYMPQINLCLHVWDHPLPWPKTNFVISIFAKQNNFNKFSLKKYSKSHWYGKKYSDERSASTCFSYSFSSRITYHGPGIGRPRYWTYEDATCYGWSLGAIVYCCIFMNLKGQGQGHSIKFKVKLKMFSEWSEKSSERFWRRKYANFAHDIHLITQGHA